MAAHLVSVTAETPLPSKRLVIRSRKASTLSEWRPFFGWDQNNRARGMLPYTSAKQLFVDRVFAIDLALDRIGDGDHSLIVFQHPAQFAAF